MAVKVFTRGDLNTTREAVKKFRAGSLPVIKTGFLAAGEKTLIPVVKVDASNRPDLLDLARVCRTEGDFNTDCEWRILVKAGYTGLARLDVRLNSPIKTNFSILFNLEQHAKYLGEVVDGFSFLGVHLVGTPLQDALAYVFHRNSLAEGLALYLLANEEKERRRGNGKI